MSGYDEQTGWVSFTASKWSRYFNRLPDDVEDEHMEPIIFARLKRARIAYYLGAVDTLFARCNAGTLWTILSGLPATFGLDEPPRDPVTQWLSVTDMGSALTNPALPPSSVLKLLRQAGFLTRIDGKDVPTERADGLFMEARGDSRRPVQGHVEVWDQAATVGVRGARSSPADGVVVVAVGRTANLGTPGPW